jgi:hypothetical protein
MRKLPLKLTAVLIFALLFYSCKTYHRNKTFKDVPLASIKRGEALAEKYCQSCHMLPDPSLLDAKTWEKGALPYMGPNLGLFEFGFDQYPSMRGDRYLDKTYYPSKPMVQLDEWQSIMDYYTATSPDSLPAQHRDKKIKIGLPLFNASEVHLQDGPAITYIGIDTTTNAHKLIAFDHGTGTLMSFDANAKLIDSISMKGAVADVVYNDNKLLLCNMMYLVPTNMKLGKLQKVLVTDSNHFQLDTVPILDSLARPVRIEYADFNQDGKQDLLVGEFGFLRGGLNWYENLGDGKYLRHPIRSLPGVLKMYVNDYNNDGLPDIWALFSQGEEGIFLFTNKGHGQFEEREVLRFPSVNGSSNFELDDFNKDGFPDILYTCGDNADYSRVLKPYHGVYIYINDGRNNFDKKYFFPINGCYKAIGRDFDGDGDLDIACISFFADYLTQPEEGFVYLENKGNLDFDPFSIPEAVKGRWLTMEAGDLDGDGKPDLVLGNFTLGFTNIKGGFDWKKGPSILILKNLGKTK